MRQNSIDEVVAATAALFLAFSQPPQHGTKPAGVLWPLHIWPRDAPPESTQSFACQVNLRRKNVGGNPRKHTAQALIKSNSNNKPLE